MDTESASRARWIRPFTDGGDRSGDSGMIETLIDSFIHYRRAGRNNSEHTLRAYAGDLSQLAEFLDSRGIEGLESVDLNVLRSFLGEFKGAAKTTIARKQASLRAFFR